MSVWGSPGPLPTLATMTLPGVIAWRYPTSGTLSMRGGGWKFLKSPPPHPLPYGLCHGGHMVAKYPLLHDPSPAVATPCSANARAVKGPSPVPHSARR